MNRGKRDRTRVLVRDRGDVKRVLAQKWQTLEVSCGRSGSDEVGVLVSQGEYPCECDDEGGIGMRGDCLGIEVVAWSDPHQVACFCSLGEGMPPGAVGPRGGVSMRSNGVDRMRIHRVSFDLLSILGDAAKVQTHSAKNAENRSF